MQKTGHTIRKVIDTYEINKNKNQKDFRKRSNINDITVYCNYVCNHNYIYRNNGFTIMSYKKSNTNDGIYDLFSNLAYFTNIVPNLINTKTKKEFNLWFDKLFEIDKRSLKLYLEKNKNKINPENYEYINIKYNKKIL